MSIPYRSLTLDRQHTLHDGKAPPNYEQAVSTSSQADSASIMSPQSTGGQRYHGQNWQHNSLGENMTPMRQPSLRRPLPNPSLNYERYVYKYRLVAGNTPLQFLISVEPHSGRPSPGKYTFRLSFKVNGIERPLGEPVQRTLASNVDPRYLEFVVFVFPGKSSIPAGCLWSLRVWLRVNSIDHRLFGEDELWVGKDPDFNSIGDASFARLKHQDADRQVYSAFVGRALVTFLVKWVRVTGSLYKYSLSYESGGVGSTLIDDFRLRIDGDPKTITFLIFTIPSNSVPSGASHKLRVWLRTIVPMNQADPVSSYVLPFHDSYIYQRIWKTDDFKIGAHLNFESLGPKMIMAFSSGGSETIPMAHPPHQHTPSNSMSSTDGMKKEEYNF